MTHSTPPAPEPSSRKLAAILAADVVGYTRMIAINEGDTVQALHALRAEVFG